jgi:hypothetical protein
MLRSGRQGWGHTILIASAIALVGCHDDVTPTGPSARSGPSLLRSDARASGAVHETASDHLARVLPGFGGAYVENGSLHLWVRRTATVPGIEAMGEQEVAALFAASKRKHMPLEWHDAVYSYTELKAWEAALTKEYSAIGVNSAQVDERANRVHVDVMSTASEAALRSTLVALHIPSDAVTSDVGRAPSIFTAVTDRVRPTRGGLEIQMLWTYQGQSQPPGIWCTYGFNAQINDGSGTRLMVTNAHCVEPENVFGGLDGATVAQTGVAPGGNIPSGDLVGYVTVNPASSSGQVGCAAGDTCRASDAVLVTVDNGAMSTSDWDLGGIVRLSSRAVGPNSQGSTTIDAGQPRISLVDANSTFFVGDTLEKVGARTGWTAGVVTGTCVYVSINGQGRMCNGAVSAGANSGDSGSPVIWRNSSGAYFLMGELWGGVTSGDGGPGPTFYFSRWDNIKAELSPYATLNVGTGTGQTLDCVPQPGQQCAQ